MAYKQEYMELAIELAKKGTGADDSVRGVLCELGWFGNDVW